MHINRGVGGGPQRGVVAARAVGGAPAALRSPGADPRRGRTPNRSAQREPPWVAGQLTEPSTPFPPFLHSVDPPKNLVGLPPRAVDLDRLMAVGLGPQPSDLTEPGATLSSTTARRLEPAPSAIPRSLIRPMPLPSSSAVSTFNQLPAPTRDDRDQARSSATSATYAR